VVPQEPPSPVPDKVEPTVVPAKREPQVIVVALHIKSLDGATIGHPKLNVTLYEPVVSGSKRI
jgi:hypothetical protein